MDNFTNKSKNELLQAWQELQQENDSLRIRLASETAEKHEMESSLSSILERSDLLMKAANFAWWEMDIPTGSVKFSDRKAEMLGYPPDNFKHYSDFMALVHPDDYETAMQVMRSHFAGKTENYDTLYRIRTSSGEYKWFHDIGKITHRDSTGKPLVISGIVIDIIDKIKLCEAQNETDIRFKLMFQDHKSVMLLIDPSSMEIIDANTSAEQFYNYPLHQLKGMHIDKINILSKDEVAVESDKALNGEQNLFKFSHRISGGEVRQVEVHSSPIELNGRKLLFSIIHDVTERDAIERKLKNSEDALRKAEEIEKFGNWQFHLAENIITASDGAKIIYGFSENIVLYSVVKNMVLSQYRPLLDNALSGLMHKGEAYDVEYKIKRLTDGEIIDIHSKAEYNAAKGIVFGTIQDITERKNVENALHESEEKFREMADMLPQIIFETDPQGKLTYVNKQAFAVLKYPKNQDVLGLQTMNLYIPEDQARAIGNFKSSLEGKHDGGNEYTMVCFDGSLINVIVYANPIIRNNKTLGLRGIIVDITNIKNTEDELRESEYKYRILTESMKDVVWTLDPRTMRFLYVSPSVEKLSGYTPAEIIAQPFNADLTNEGVTDVKSFLFGEIEKFLASGAKDPHFVVYEMEQPCKDGSLVWTEVVTNFYLNRKNGEVEVLGVTRDISERKQAESALRNSKQQYDRVVSNIPVGLYILRVKPDGSVNFDYGSPRFLEMFETTAEILTADAGKIYQKVHPADYDYFMKLRKAAIAQQQAFEWTGRVKLETSVKWLHFTSTPDPQQNGDVLWHGLVVDITERKMIEDALAESEELYRLLFENSGEAILYTQPDGTISSANPEACRIFGRTETEIKKLGRAGLVDLKDPRLKPALDQRANTGHFKGELSMLRNDGTTFQVELSSSVYKDSRGIDKTSMIIRDISETKRAEALIRKSEVMLSEAGRLAKMGGWELDMSTMELTWTEETYRIHEVSSDHFKPNVDQAIGFYPPEARPIILAAIEQARTQGISYDLELPFITAKGRDLWVRSIGNVQQVEGHTVRIYGIFQDITERKQVDQALQKNKNQLDQILQTTDQGIYGIDMEGKCTFINQSGLRKIGYQSGECIGHDMHTLIHHSHSDGSPYDVSECPIFRAKNTGKGSHLDNEVFWRKDGSSFPAEYSSYPTFENGEISGAVITFSDITERKRVLEELRQSEEKYRMLFNVNNDSISILSLDAHGKPARFIEMNEAAAMIYGYSREELLESKLVDIEGEVPADVMKQRFEALIKDGQANFETSIKDKFGNDRSIDVKVVMINYMGQNALMNISRDITERKQAEKALSESEAKYRLITEFASDVIWVFNYTKRKFTYISPSVFQLRGVTMEEALAESIHDSFVPDAINTIETIMKAEVQEFINNPSVPHSNVHQLRQLHKDGSIVWVESSSKIRYTADGDIEIVGVSRNIVERKKMEQDIRQREAELQQMVVEKDKFFSIIAHDLRGPFNGFLGLTQIMAEKLPELTMAEVQQIAISMKNSATNLFRLLENLLHWAQFQQGLIPFDPKILHLQSVVNESIAMALEPARNKGIEISYPIPADIEIFADSNMLQTVIRNLVSNAVKFTPKGGKILLSAKVTDTKSVEISVNDSGIGMNDDILTNLFRINIQTNRKGTDGEASTGLGLIICKEFIEKHGGQLFIESEVGKGSTFRFTIPFTALPETLSTVPAEVPEDKPAQKAPGLKILIAEDDETSGMLISIALKSFSREIIMARTGIDAVEVCKNNPDLDLIMMDIKMPDMDGYAATNKIRQFNKKVIIIAQTAFEKAGDRELSVKAGFNDYMSKPLSVSLLKQVIKRHFPLL